MHAAAHDAAIAAERRRAGDLIALARMIACTTPREGECERTWLALQARAARVLKEFEGG
ncbi:MAG TPA: hypothetical protein VFL07_19170 [Rudaea sp.]|nr:hypothetical protein [Rudaea sp.]